jgi:hypothetical protein
VLRNVEVVAGRHSGGCNIGPQLSRMDERSGTVFIPAEVEDAEIAVGRVPPMRLALAKINRRVAPSMAPIPELSRRGDMEQRLSVAQVGRGWIEHAYIYPPCSP